MKLWWPAPLLAASCIYAAAGYAQMTLLPEACIGKRGDELDKCVRDLTPPYAGLRFEPVELGPNPAQMVNCLNVSVADREFCVRRNEVIVECRNAVKYRYFDRCFATYIALASKPVVADCRREKPELRAMCASRNAVFVNCFEEPLRYFICIDNKGKRE